MTTMQAVSLSGLSQDHDAKQPRTIREIQAIALEIRRVWPNVHYSAEPYLVAMTRMFTVNDHYGFESGRDILTRFLANAKTWRGEDARRLKAEIKALLGR